MKQASSIGKGALNLCKAYWHWVNQVADNHKIPEKKLSEMVQKKQFKTPEEAERATKRTIKTALAAAPLIFLAILIWSVLPKSKNQSEVVQPPAISSSSQTEQSPQNSADAPTSEAKPNSPTETVPPSLESQDISIGASVQVKGLDFSYQTMGRIQETDRSIVVTYAHTWECGEEAPVNIARQEWQAVFDLSSKTWTDKVRELSNCLGSADQQWIDYSMTPSQFSIESSGSETVIRADAQDTDGSIIVKDSLVVKYTKP